MSIGLELDIDEGRQPSEDETRVELDGQEEQEKEPYENVLIRHV